MLAGRLILATYEPRCEAPVEYQGVGLTWAVCDPENGRRGYKHRDHVKGDKAETKRLKAVARSNKPEGYTWPLWHQPRKAAEKEPTHPIAYAGFRLSTQWAVAELPRPPGFNRWLKARMTRPYAPGASDAAAQSADSAFTQRRAAAAPNPARRQTMSLPTTKTTSTPPAGWTPGQPLPTPAPVPSFVPLTMDQQNALSPADLLAYLQAENAYLKARKPTSTGKITWRVCDRITTDPKTKETKAPSYAVSVYGLGRFPVTLYREQWSRFFSVLADFDAFLHSPETLALTSKSVKA